MPSTRSSSLSCVRPPVPETVEPSQASSFVRIGLIVHTFETGGIERHVAKLASRLDRRRFQPVIICLERSGAAAQWIETDDVPIIELNKKPRNDLGLVFRLARTLRTERLDVVHSHNWGTLLETALARRWAGTPVHVHAERGTVLGQVEPRGPRMRLRKLAMAWAVKRATAVVSNAEAVARRAALAAGIALERVQVIPNGLDPPRMPAEQDIKDWRGRFSIPDDALLVGSVGRLAAVKNFGDAVKAVARLRGTGPQVHLLLVGDGPERAALERLARELDIWQRVHFAGWRQDVAAALAAMDVYVNCSVSEGMSQSVVEAMAMGLPLVVTDVGDSALLVGGDCACGLIVAPGDPVSLAGAIEKLVDVPALRQVFRESARARFAERYSFDRMLSSYESLYTQLHSAANLVEARS